MVGSAAERDPVVDEADPVEVVGEDLRDSGVRGRPGSIGVDEPPEVGRPEHVQVEHQLDARSVRVGQGSDVPV